MFDSFHLFKFTAVFDLALNFHFISRYLFPWRNARALRNLLLVLLCNCCLLRPITCRWKDDGTRIRTFFFLSLPCAIYSSSFGPDEKVGTDFPRWKMNRFSFPLIALYVVRHNHIRSIFLYFRVLREFWPAASNPSSRAFNPILRCSTSYIPPRPWSAARSSLPYWKLLAHTSPSFQL